MGTIGHKNNLGNEKTDQLTKYGVRLQLFGEFKSSLGVKYWRYKFLDTKSKFSNSF